MNQISGTLFIFLSDTGRAGTTADAWIWTAATGRTIGTWRTSNRGCTWKTVESNEHPHGQMQIYQPDKSSIAFMPGSIWNSALES